ncbi:MAG: hypothetical protein KAS15_04015 [Nanoarchaeota archaeon]|nr:hypothetical protein [Nanoarchaeota archaeon]MCK5630533.1 hypothetical protein [Nanoarchaeota archaeon]
MRKNMKKKGALELSVNSIVVMVIAFIVLGLILTFTYRIFSAGGDQVKDIFTMSKFSTPPDAENPIFFPEEIDIKSKAVEKIEVGFYNRNSYTAKNAIFGIHSCKDQAGNDIVTSGEYDDGINKLPRITSSSQSLEGSEGIGFKIMLIENGLPSGTNYICNLIVYNEEIGKAYEIDKEDLAVRNADSPVYGSQQIFIEIIA